jgi:Tfp pilus assembly protein PilV
MALRIEQKPAQPRGRLRRGLTLVELLIASTVMAMIVAAMSALALAAPPRSMPASRWRASSAPCSAPAPAKSFPPPWC